MRYFRTMDAAKYEAIRAQFDGAYGYPNADTKTSTSITPAADAPVDAQGRVYLIASDEECRYPVVAEKLPALLSSEVVQEVSPSEFAAQFLPPF